MKTVKFKIYRYDPEVDKKPYMKEYQLEVDNPHIKVLTAIEMLKEQDPTIAVRRSCREGVFVVSDGMNINGKNRLACITNIKRLERTNSNKTITWITCDS